MFRYLSSYLPIIRQICNLCFLIDYHPLKETLVWKKVEYIFHIKTFDSSHLIADSNCFSFCLSLMLEMMMMMKKEMLMIIMTKVGIQ